MTDYTRTIEGHGLDGVDKVVVKVLSGGPNVEIRVQYDASRADEYECRWIEEGLALDTFQALNISFNPSKNRGMDCADLVERANLVERVLTNEEVLTTVRDVVGE